MSFRWGPGPVFAYESLAAARRRQLYAARSLFALCLLAALGFVWARYGLNIHDAATAYQRKQLAEVGGWFFKSLAGLQLALVFLVAPAATAGAICLDRARGSLLHMMVTDLSDAEIVLGKLAARLAPVVALLATGLPVIAFSTLLGGVIPESTVNLIVVSLATAVLGCSLALAVSARVRKTHEVLMAVYTAWGFWLLSAPFAEMLSRAYTWPPPPDAFVKLNPFVLVYGPYWRPNWIEPWDVAVFVAVTAVISLGAIAFALKTLRREPPPATHGLERFDRLFGLFQRHVVSRMPSPGMDPNPVLWREWHRNRPSPTAQRVWILYVSGAVAGTAAGVVDLLTHPGRPTGPFTMFFVNGFVVSFGLLFLSALAPNAMAEERVRGSLDVLMSTPMSTASIVLGKWWGAFRTAPILALFPAVGCLFVAVMGVDQQAVSGRVGWFVGNPINRVAAFVFPVAWVLAFGALFTSLGVALSVWSARPGRAVATSVAAFLVASALPIFLAEGVVGPMLRSRVPSTMKVVNPGAKSPVYVQVHRYDIGAIEGALISMSPFGSQFVAPQAAFGHDGLGRRVNLWAGQVVLLAATSGLSALLLWLTIATFDRCLGRVSDRPGREPPGAIPGVPSHGRRRIRGRVEV